MIAPSDLAIYSAGMRVTQFGSLPIQVYLRIIYPGFFLSFKEGGGAAALGYGYLRLGWVCLLGLVVCLLMIASSFIVDDVLGPGYAEAAFIIQLASALWLVTGASYIFGDVLVSMGLESKRAWISIFASSVQIAFLFPLVFLFGPVGGVLSCYIAAGTSLLACFVMCVSQAHKIGLVRKDGHG